MSKTETSKHFQTDATVVITAQPTQEHKSALMGKGQQFQSGPIRVELSFFFVAWRWSSNQRSQLQSAVQEKVRCMLFLFWLNPNLGWLSHLNTLYFFNRSLEEKCVFELWLWWVLILDSHCRIQDWSLQWNWFTMLFCGLLFMSGTIFWPRNFLFCFVFFHLCNMFLIASWLIQHTLKIVLWLWISLFHKLSFFVPYYTSKNV